MDDVIIVGAGVSGLAAADSLRDAGINCLVLEARNRLGGRIHTDYQFGFPIEYGAGWLHDVEHNVIAKNKEKYSLKLIDDHYGATGIANNVLYDQDFNICTIIERERLRIIFQRFLKELCHLSPNLSLSQFLNQFSIPEYTEIESRKIKLWIVGILLLWEGAEFSDTNIKTWKEYKNQNELLVLNGFDKVIKYLSRNLDVSLSSPVNAIDYNDKKVKVYSNGNIYTASKVIVTVPLGVLKSNDVSFYPELPINKQNSITHLGCALLNRSILIFKDCFWHKDSFNLHCFPSSDSQIVNYHNYYALCSQPVLVAWHGGDYSSHLENYPEQKLMNVLLSPLQKMYPDTYQSPVKVKTTRWQNDPYARCSYSYLPGDIDESDFNVLSAPIDNRIYFAGEATSSDANGTVHGAFESGIRAASEVLSSL